MIKKIVIISVVALGVGFLVAGPGAFSHVTYLFSKARSGIQEAIPVEYELERAQAMIEKITPEIERGRKVVAQEEVETSYLEAAIARLEGKQARDAERLKARSRMLKAERASFVIAGKRYPRQALEAELALAFKKFKQNDQILESKRRLLAARRRSLQAARANLAAAANAREELMTRVEHLKARLREERALAAASGVLKVDSGALASAREILDRCQKRLDVLHKLREDEQGATITLTDDDILPTRDLLGEMERYFGEEIDRASTAVEAPRTVDPLVLNDR